MKNKFKRILPILFTIIVLLSLVWYLLIYDTDFTRDVLVHQARFFEANGKHTISAWLYNQAYAQSGNNEAVAIELADQYKHSGNYSKAEATLTGAIANNPTVNLYIALCKTYVEQDKLLDAVTMLDSIQNPTLKAQVDALRPAAPTASPAPAYYNQYLTVQVTADRGVLYISSTREYPTTDVPADGKGIDLVAGTNTIRAVCIDENGLVSPLATMVYTVGNVVEELKIQDPSMDAAIRQELGMNASAKLYSTDLWKITQFTVPEDALNIIDLVNFSYLQTLTIENSGAVGFSALRNLTQLKELNIRGCNLSASDMMAISTLPNLEKLTITDCGLSEIDVLANAKKLKYLDLSNNLIKDVSGLSFLSNLKTLLLSHNALTNLNDLSTLSGLEKLDISYNSVTSLLPLATCKGLKHLDAGTNLLTDLSGAEGMTNLNVLLVSFNQLTDVSAVSGCSKLTQLDISDNNLTNISALSALQSLENLNFSRNQVTTLPTWEKDCALVTINGAYNKLQTIASLAGYKVLNNVYMDYNKINSVKALAECPMLIRVDVYGNPVKDISALKDKGVTVNYTPQ